MSIQRLKLKVNVLQFMIMEMATLARGFVLSKYS